METNIVDYVAHLARIDLTAEEHKLFSVQLKDILHFIDRLDKLDTSSIAATSHILPLENVVRADERKPPLSPDEALRNAPSRSGSFFSVPQIID
jgi:aspartyl-tRNA(Asn)/glutamyl-tRNA(Gln) amidotransferase subunit C